MSVWQRAEGNLTIGRDASPKRKGGMIPQGSQRCPGIKKDGRPANVSVKRGGGKSVDLSSKIRNATGIPHSKVWQRFEDKAVTVGDVSLRRRDMASY